MISDLALLALSLAFSWVSRPSQSTEWSGERAADFASGLIITLAAGGSLFGTMTGNLAAMTLLSGLAWYAAMPLIVLVRVAQAASTLGMPSTWSREIWGRILLVQCVIFELARRSELAFMIPQVTLIAGLIALCIWAVLPLAPVRQLLTRLTVPTLWGVITLTYLIYFPDDLYVLGAPLAILLLQTRIRSSTP